MEWKNPHGFIYIDVKGADGRVESWAIETGSVGIMAKRGLTPADFRPGSEIIVGGWRAKDGRGLRPSGSSRSPNGRPLPLGGEASFSLGR